MKMKKASLISKIVIAALVIYAVVSLVSTRSQLSAAEEKCNSLQEQVDDAMQTNSELQYAVDHSDDPETIEDVARNKIGLVKPGEKIFYDIGS